MRAVRAVAPGSFEITDVAEPDPKDQFEIRVHQVGICGTDSKILEGEIDVDHPRIMGHEMVGEVISAPPGSPYDVGTRVLVDPGVACGWCDLCSIGRPHLCRNGGLLGRDLDGVFTERVVAPIERLVPVSKDVSDKAAGLLQVLGTCVHAIKMLDPFPGQVAAVIGLGVAGQLLAQLLALRGMSVVGVTRSPWKRDLAVELGAAAVSSPDGAGDVLGEMTGGRGPDLVVEAVGKEETLAQAIELVTIGGEILAYGINTGGGQGLPYYHLYHKELIIRNPRAARTGDYADGVRLTASGEIRLEPIVSHVLTLEDAAEAFELVRDPSSLKVLMQVG